MYKGTKKYTVSVSNFEDFHAIKFYIDKCPEIKASQWNGTLSVSKSFHLSFYCTPDTLRRFKDFCEQITYSKPEIIQITF